MREHPGGGAFQIRRVLVGREYSEWYISCVKIGNSRGTDYVRNAPPLPPLPGLTQRVTDHPRRLRDCRPGQPTSGHRPRHSQRIESYSSKQDTMAAVYYIFVDEMSMIAQGLLGLISIRGRQALQGRALE